jgi:MarR family 2-MHQ and catechol resistance regulon transcriptional repressor
MTDYDLWGGTIMNEPLKSELLLNFTHFWFLFQKEFLGLLSDNSHCELSPLLFRMLNEIHLEGTITSSVLSKKLSVCISNTSRDVNKLEKLGYIIKTQDITDKRITHLMLSRKGLDLVSSSLVLTENKLLEKFNILSSGDANELSKAFSSINDMFIKMRNSNTVIGIKAD